MDFAALGAKAAQQGADYTKPATGGGGGDYTPPKEGPCRLRFVGYIEIGQHERRGAPGTPVKIEPQVIFQFEVSGPQHPPREAQDGTKFPCAIVSITEKASRHEKANAVKLFARMNHAGDAQHPAQLLGRGYKGAVVHRKYKRRDGSEGIAVELKNKDGYTIDAARYERTDENGPTGEFLPLEVPAPLSPIRCFIWNSDTDLDKQWDSLYIDGMFDERKDKEGKVTAPAASKNVLQNKIKSAKNFEGSPIHALLLTRGAPLDIPSPEEMVGDEDDIGHDDTPAEPATPQAGPQRDPLAGVA